MNIRPRSVRTRLTFWYVAVLTTVLLLYVGGASAFLFLNLRRQLDRTLDDEVESVEGRLSFTPEGQLKLAPNSRDERELPGPRDYIDIRSLDGRVLFRNEPLEGPITPAEGKDGYSERSSRLRDGTRVRLASRRHEMGNHTVLIRLALSEEPLWRNFLGLLSVLVLGLPLALLVAGLGGYALARRALSPLGVMARRAEQITAERLSDRLPIENPDDELGHVARVFNGTLARLERSFEQLQRFTADASHELRTPLTAIRSVGEVGLQNEGSAAYYRDIIGSMLEETNRLTRLVDSLLTISRADAGQIELHRVEVSLLDLVRESTSLLEVLAEEKSQRLVVDGDPETVVFVDRHLLKQAFVNLLDNAVKYSPTGGTIWVQVETTVADRAVVQVTDSGAGIPEAHRMKVFDRFYRVDKARSTELPGAGLGLSIVKWAVEANGGEIELEGAQGKGAVFRIKLPAAKVRTHAKPVI
jgi:heavy metal sensor kinase